MEMKINSKVNTPLLKTAFDLSDVQKIKRIEYHFAEIMDVLGLDLTDDSLNGTPKRVAKMFVQEAFSGLNPANKPSVSLFDNKYGYDKMLVEKDITLYSHCEHHFVPIIGKVHVAYIPKDKVIGLSKINRIVDYFAKRPQVQERLTTQIFEELKNVFGDEDIAVVVEADHLCVASRGIRDTNSRTTTSYYGGKFEQAEIKQEFLAYLNLNK
jgi:GTP cyclohydrolase I